MKESERLRAARKLIENPDNWMQGDYADNPYEFFSNACRFCSIGAVLRARTESICHEDLNDTSKYLQFACVEINGTENVIDYNDTHTHKEVLGLFDKAIEIAESEGN